uniref:Uncharacterized protein n=1 Tax=Rhodococcus erythropolis TaxID=1833 RepID=Q6XMX6_RHOER|nr:hypothetical protein PBD2.170 [Rhodococcus erythropolis]
MLDHRVIEDVDHRLTQPASRSPSSSPPAPTGACPRRYRCPGRRCSTTRRSGPRRSSTLPDPARTGPRRAAQSGRLRSTSRTCVRRRTCLSPRMSRRLAVRPVRDRLCSGGSRARRASPPSPIFPRISVEVTSSYDGAGRSPALSAARTRGRVTGIRRPLRVTEPRSRPWRTRGALPVATASRPGRGGHLGVHHRLHRLQAADGGPRACFGDLGHRHAHPLRDRGHGLVLAILLHGGPLLSEFLEERPTLTTWQVSSWGPPPQLLRRPGQLRDHAGPGLHRETRTTRPKPEQTTMNRPQRHRSRYEVHRGVGQPSTGAPSTTILAPSG